MPATNSRITAQMLVKNEDQWVYFAIMSILPYVDVLDIVDTGSTDHTLEIIRGINSTKIRLATATITTPADVTQVRQAQLERTKTPWFWVVDGDEIYPDALATEIVQATQVSTNQIIVVRRYDLLGDIYHRQHESVGQYQLYGERGHLLIRLLNKHCFPNLRLKGDYPREGYYQASTSLLDIPRQNVYVTQNYLYHAMYLQRSSLGRNLHFVYNRSKYKVETGISIVAPLPQVFTLHRPTFVPNPLRHRSQLYDFAAAIITPIKNLKRALL